MIKHIVMWKLKEHALGNSREENGKRLRSLLESLPAQIPQIREFEVGENFNPAAVAWDYCLYSGFEDQASLQTYQIHPVHVEVKNFIMSIVEETAVVDYEI